MRRSRKELIYLMALLFAAAMFAAAPRARAHEAFTPSGKDLGVGVQVGAPTAVTGKLVVGPDLALEAGVGGGIGWGPSLSVHGDVVLHPFAFVETTRLVWTPSFGAGAFLAAAPLRFQPLLPGLVWGRSFVWTGLRAPVGTSVALHEVPLEVYALAVPTVFAYPAVAFDVGGTLGVRLFL